MASLGYRVKRLLSCTSVNERQNDDDHPDFPIIRTLQNIYFPQYGEMKSQGDNSPSTGDYSNTLLTAVVEEHGDVTAQLPNDPAPIPEAATTSPRALPPPPPSPPPMPSPYTPEQERGWEQGRGGGRGGRHNARGRRGRTVATCSYPVDPNSALLYINCISRIPKGFV